MSCPTCGNQHGRAEDRIATTLEQLLELYKAHVRLTAKTARMSVAQLPNSEHILAVLDELEAVAR